MNGWDDRTVAPAACHNNTCMRKALCLHPLFIIAMSVYVLLCAPVSAQMAGVGKGFIGSAIEQGRVAARLITNKGQIPAVSIAVVINDEMVWSEAFGYADLELRAPAAAVTRFRIASISKAFTGTLVAKLVEAGKLDLDTLIRSIDPGLPEHYDAVTVRDLARHTAGVRHYATGEIAVPDYYETLEDALEVFINDPLLNAPGEAYNYSTYGYTLLGHVIEKATGMSYFDALRENILEPLGLSTVALDHRYFIRPDRSKFYEWRREYGVINAQPLDNSVKYPGGGLLSNAEDVARFGAAVASPGFLQARTLEDMLAPTVLRSGQVVDYGAGWTLRRDGRGRSVYGHSGRQPGVRAQLYVYPASGVSIATLSNMSNSSIGFDEFQVLTEPFVEFAEGRSFEPASIDPVGVYEIEIIRDEPIKATLDIWQREQDGGLSGSIRLNQNGSRFMMPSVVVNGKRIRVIGFTVGQLIDLDFVLGANGVGEGTAMVGDRVPLTVTRRHE